MNKNYTLSIKVRQDAYDIINMFLDDKIKEQSCMFNGDYNIEPPSEPFWTHSPYSFNYKFEIQSKEHQSKLFEQFHDDINRLFKMACMEGNIQT